MSHSDYTGFFLEEQEDERIEQEKRKSEEGRKEGQAPEAEQEEKAVNYHDLTNKELKALLDEQGVEYNEKDNKDTLVELLITNTEEGD